MLLNLVLNVLLIPPVTNPWVKIGHLEESGFRIEGFGPGDNFAVTTRNGLEVFDIHGMLKEFRTAAGASAVELFGTEKGLDWWVERETPDALLFHCLHIEGTATSERELTTRLDIGAVLSIRWSPDRSQGFIETMSGVWSWKGDSRSVFQVASRSTDDYPFYIDYVGKGVLRWDVLAEYGESLERVLAVQPSKDVTHEMKPGLPGWNWRFSPSSGKAFSEDGKALDLKNLVGKDLSWRDLTKRDARAFAVARDAPIVVYGMTFFDERGAGDGVVKELYIVDARSLDRVKIIDPPRRLAGLAISPDGRFLAAIVGKDVVVQDIGELNGNGTELL